MAQIGSYNSPITIDAENQVVISDIVISTVAPASATAAGTAGEIRVVAGFIYTCVAADTWQRVATATWV